MLCVPVVVAVVGVATLAGAGGGASADTSLVGYNASALAIGSQYAFNIPGLVPLPNENLIEEDVPFARTNVGAGPVVDSIGPDYPGDIAASLGSLLLEFGAPSLPINDPLLAESKTRRRRATRAAPRSAWRRARPRRPSRASTRARRPRRARAAPPPGR